MNVIDIVNMIFTRRFRFHKLCLPYLISGDLTELQNNICHCLTKSISGIAGEQPARHFILIIKANLHTYA